MPAALPAGEAVETQTSALSGEPVLVEPATTEPAAATEPLSGAAVQPQPASSSSLMGRFFTSL